MEKVVIKSSSFSFSFLTPNDSATVHLCLVSFSYTSDTTFVCVNQSYRPHQ